MKLLRLIPFFALGMALPLAAQDEEYYTKEVGGGLGLTSVLSDANGTLLGKPSTAVGGVVRFVFNPRAALRTRMAWHGLSGNLHGVQAFYPDRFDAPTAGRRTYTFSGGIADVSAVYELHLLPYGYYRNYLGYSRLVPFFQAGIGVAYGTIDRQVAVSFPVGVGVKYKLRPRLNLTLDWAMHFTANDRLEGLEAPVGIRSELFRNKDHYGTAMLTLTYDISPRCPTCNKAD